LWLQLPLEAGQQGLLWGAKKGREKRELAWLDQPLALKIHMPLNIVKLHEKYSLSVKSQKDDSLLIQNFRAKLNH